MPHFSVENATTCMDHCLPSCEHIRFVSSDSKPSQNAFQSFEDPHFCQSELIICASSFQYPLFSEKPGWTFYSFVAALGAVLGIWLPLDFVFFVEWLFKITEWLVTRICRFLVRKMGSKKLKEAPRRRSRMSRNGV